MCPVFRIWPSLTYWLCKFRKTLSSTGNRKGNTPVLTKVMESIVGERLWNIVGPQIGSNQFGGLNGSSTTHALVHMLHHWHLHANRMNISKVLLFDYSKAFDLVDHNIIVKGCTAMMFLIFLCIGLAVFCLTEDSMCELIKNYLTGFM